MLYNCLLVINWFFFHHVSTSVYSYGIYHNLIRNVIVISNRLWKKLHDTTLASGRGGGACA